MGSIRLIRNPVDTSSDAHTESDANKYVAQAPHPTRISRSAPKPLVKAAPQAGLPWTAQEVSALEKAYMSVPPSKPNFWKVRRL